MFNMTFWDTSVLVDWPDVIRVTVEELSGPSASVGSRVDRRNPYKDLNIGLAVWVAEYDKRIDAVMYTIV